MLIHGSLFSGIGGFELAAEWAGWTNAFHCEWNDFGKQVLQYYWPESESFHDIKKSDFKKYEGRIDIITGGFPCQPFSAAGKRKGADDDRYLWPEMLRVIDEVKPRWVVGENVAGIISMVQPGDEVTVESGRTLFDEEYSETVLRQEYVIETVCKDLERLGYTVQPVVIPACAAGAPHRRDRIWFIAHAIDCGYRTDGNTERDKDKIQGKHREEICAGLFDRADNVVAPDTIGIGCDGNSEKGGNNKPGGYRHMVQNSGWNGDKIRGETERCGEITPDTKSERRTPFNRPESKEFSTQEESVLYGRSGFGFGERPTWDKFPTQSPVRWGNDGVSSRLVGITVSKHRIESIKAYGNAIVPQVAYEIFKAINEIERNIKQPTLF
jgi:DNA (cytosine-5)-methyltransferase 1